MIADILNRIYGIGLLLADPITVLWAAERIEDDDTAKRELAEANRIRARHGLMAARPAFGSRLF